MSSSGAETMRPSGSFLLAALGSVSCRGESIISQMQGPSCASAHSMEAATSSDFSQRRKGKP